MLNDVLTVLLNICLGFEEELSCFVPIPVAERSKVRVCGRLVTGIAGSNPATGMDVCLLCVV